MYIVTGGAGFIGSHVVRALNEVGIDDILVVDDLTRGDKFLNIRDAAIRDYIDRHEFQAALREGAYADAKVEAVLHQGACTDTTNHDGAYMMRTNYDDSKRLLQFCTERRIPFVYASSAATYGASTVFAEKPENEKPLNVYGYSKLQFDRHVRRMQPTFTNTVVGLRYFNVYGPHERHKGKMASMVYQLYRQLKTTGVARLFDGTDGYAAGEQRRDFVLGPDVAKVNVSLARGPKRFGIHNCGTGVARSFNDIANSLIAEMGTGKVEYIAFPESLRGKYQSFTEADLTTLRGNGYEDEFTSLEAGIKQSIGKWNQEPT